MGLLDNFNSGREPIIDRLANGIKNLFDDETKISKIKDRQVKEILAGLKVYLEQDGAISRSQTRKATDERDGIKPADIKSINFDAYLNNGDILPILNVPTSGIYIHKIIISMPTVKQTTVFAYLPQGDTDISIAPSAARPGVVYNDERLICYIHRTLPTGLNTIYDAGATGFFIPGNSTIIVKRIIGTAGIGAMGGLIIYSV